MSGSGERFTDVDVTNKRLPACFGYIAWKVLPIEQAMADLNSCLREINRFVKLAKRYCTFPNDHQLTKDEATAIYIYTMEMSEDECIYRILNQTLRLEDRTKVRPWFPYLKLFDSAVAKLPTFKGVVWRGVNKDVSQSFKKGQKLTWWSISSCSTSVKVISSFLGEVPESTLFNIQCSTGKCIAAYTCYPSENEIILMPGTTFEVVDDPLHHHGGLHIVHLKEINEEDDDEDDDKQRESIELATPQPMAAASVSQKFEKLIIDPYHASPSKPSDTFHGTKNTMTPTKPLPKPVSMPKPEDKEFAEPGSCDKLYCEGRPCAKCHKCRDWNFTGDLPMWNWVCNYDNWSPEDKKLWYGGRYKLFTKRHGATCYYDRGDYDDYDRGDGYGSGDDYDRGDLGYGSGYYGDDYDRGDLGYGSGYYGLLGRLLGHVCLCEMH